MSKYVLVWITVVFFAVASSLKAEEKVDFQTQIQPIFIQSCVECHGEEKRLGRLRLHTAALLKERLGEKQELLVPGEPDKSLIYERLTLPADDAKRMPKDADPLPQETIELIARWIREGAELPDAAATEDDPPQPAATEQADAEAAEEPAELPLPEVEPAAPEALDQLTATGAQVMPLFAGSPLLQVSFAHRGDPATDADLAHLAGVADQVYALNLSAAQVSADGLAPIAQLENLSMLHLDRSNLTDEGLQHLAGLSRLQYLNLYGTNISDEGLQHLAGLKHLRRLYLWQTNVSYEAAMQMETAIPGLVVNLGYNHPEVVRRRLTQELDLVKQQAEEAKAEQESAEQQLEAAKKNAEAVNARLAQIEKELKELDEPAEDEEEPADADAAEAADVEAAEE